MHETKIRSIYFYLHEIICQRVDLIEPLQFLAYHLTITTKEDRFVNYQFRLKKTISILKCGFISF